MTNLAATRAAEPLRIVSGDGIHVTSAEGRTFVEAMSGLWCTGLGWGNEEIVEAATQQMRQLAYYHGFTGRQTDASEELAARLIALAPDRLRGGRVFFGQSGSDANDTQVRLLWHLHHVEGRPAKRKFISRQRGYHGVTLAAGSLTGLSYVHGASGLPLDFVAGHVTCPSYYREGRAGESEEQFVARLAAELEAAIVDAGGAEEVAAFIAEPLQGAGGVVVPPAGYHAATRAVCDRHDVRIIGDEVITGLGRLGTFWGCEAVGQQPDMLSAAKQLTSGYLPLSATLLPPGVYDALEDATAASGGIFGHGYTYSGHPVACAVANKVLDIMERDGLVQKVGGELGPAFQRRLAALAPHPLVGEARGAGLIGAVELVADKTTRQQHAPALGVGGRVVQSALDRGLVVRALAGDVVAVCPPLIATLRDIDHIFDILEAALDDAQRSL